LHAVRRTGRALGTDVSIVALHGTQADAEWAIDAAFAELETVESIMSLYRPESQICRLNETRDLLKPHPYLVQVLRKAQRVSAASNGAFDVTVQPLWTLYANSSAAGRLPSPADIDRIRKHVDWRKVLVSDDRIELKGAGTAITLNGIAQGFAADCVLAALAANGVQHALVDTGEIGTRGRRGDSECWTIGVKHPRQPDALIQRVPLAGRCLATSGDYEATFTPDYANNHIFDPHTGHSPQVFQSVTAVAKTGLEADVLSTAVFVAGLERGIKLIEACPGADGFFVLKSGETRATAGFRGEV
jgi:thiamine biosynthesis lipoprotein